MDLILEGIKQAFLLLFGLDREVLGITLLSLEVSGAATLISLFIGMSIGTAIALTDFPGKRIVISLINLFASQQCISNSSSHRLPRINDRSGYRYEYVYSQDCQ